MDLIDEQTLRWTSYTYDIFPSRFSSRKIARAGIMKVSSYTLQIFNGQNKSGNVPKSKFSALVRHFRMLDHYEIEMFDHLKLTS